MTVLRLPQAVLFLVRHAGLGFAVAAATVAAILLLDADGLGALLTGTTHHPWPVLLLWFFLGLTFGSAQFAFAVMLMADPDDSEHGSGTPMRPRPVRVRAKR